MWILFGRNMTVAPHLREAVMALNPKDAVRDHGLLRRCLWALGGVNLGFAFHSVVHLEPATVALLGASAFMLLGHARGRSNETEEMKYLAEVEWKTIFFFIGLFILVGGLVKVGAIRYLAERLVNVTEGNMAEATLAVLFGSAVLSAFVDNIPYVAAMNPLIVDLARSLHPDVADYTALVHQPDIIPLWWALALGACLGGNGTIIGASANVVIVDIARKGGCHISFWQFFKLGFPVMIGSVAISAVYLWILFLR
jgi:Na+/H+ antiporter NhaD/arsenite permease-like protein